MSFHKVWKPRKKSRKSSRKMSRKNSSKSINKKVKFTKPTRRYRAKGDFKVNKNNLELNTYDISIRKPSILPKYTRALLKDQGDQCYKTLNRDNHTIFAGAQGYHFEPIARASDLIDLFSFVPHFRDYRDNQNKGTNDDAYTGPPIQRLWMYGLKIMLSNIYFEYKLKNITNTNAFVKMYVLKPRYDINYEYIRKVKNDVDDNDSTQVNTIEGIFSYGIEAKNSIDTINGGNAGVTGNTVGALPFDSIYLTKTFKVLSKFTREFKISDGGVADIKVNIPLNKIVSYERLYGNNQLGNTTNPYDMYLKGLSYAIMFVYYGDMGINESSTGTKVLTTMPVNLAKLRNTKYDFKVCNMIKPKVQRVGALDQFGPTTGTNKIVDDAGNVENFSSLLPINP